MDKGLQRAVVAVLLTLLGPCTPYLHYRPPWPAAPSARVRSDGLVRESVWSFPAKHEVTPVVPKRTSATRVPPHLYLQQSWPATLSARDRSDGLVRESVWSIPSKQEVTPVLSKRTSATRVPPHLYLQQPWPVAPSARVRSDGLVKESIWSFPYKYERTPAVAKRMLETRVGDPCSVDEVTQEARQSRHDNCAEAAATTTTATPAPLPSHRPLRMGGWWSRPLSDDTRLDFVGVLAVVIVKIIMSTALASWFLVAGQLLFVIADITGSSEIFGNGSPLSFIFQALPLVEILLRGSAAFNS